LIGARKGKMDIQVILGRNKELIINHKSFDISGWTFDEVGKLKMAADMIEKMIINRNKCSKLNKDIMLKILTERIEKHQSNMAEAGDRHDLNDVCNVEIREKEAQDIYNYIDKMF